MVSWWIITSVLLTFTFDCVLCKENYTYSCLVGDQCEGNNGSTGSYKDLTYCCNFGDALSLSVVSLIQVEKRDTENDTHPEEKTQAIKGEVTCECSAPDVESIKEDIKKQLSKFEEWINSFTKYFEDIFKNYFW